MSYIKWTFIIAFWVLFGAFLHYTLPQRDTVYITGVEIKLEQFGENSIFWASPDTGASAEGGYVERDVRFIDAVQADGDVMVYRNEDTGFWPPYFKFDSSNLQAEARDLSSNRDDPHWVSILHYGWRIPWLTAFPNAISVTEVEGPDVRFIPWVNIVILLFVAAVAWGVTVRWMRFKARKITPVVQGIEDGIEERRAGVSRWFATWRKKPR